MQNNKEIEPSKSNLPTIRCFLLHQIAKLTRRIITTEAIGVATSRVGNLLLSSVMAQRRLV
jgi:hypothetical protein